MRGIFPCTAQDYNYKNYTTDDGLAGSTVYQVFQDSRKYIWFATENGVSCFDGSVFKNYTIADGLPDNEVFSIHEDSKGRIWFLTHNGTPAYFYNDTIINFANLPAFKKLKINSFLSCFYEDKTHNIWLGTFRNGLLQITPEEEVFNRMVPNWVNIFKIWENENGELLFISGTDGEGGVFNLKTGKNIRSFNFRKNSIYPRFCDLSDTSFLCSHRNGILAWNASLKNAPTHLFDLPDSASVLSIAADTIQYYVCSTNGVYAISRKTNKVVAHWLPHKSISSILIDHENNIWLSSLDEGVFFLGSTNMAFKSFNKEGLLSENIVTAIMKDHAGNLWIGENNLIEILSPKGEKRKKTLQSDLGNRNKVTCFLEDKDGTVWCGADRGFMLLKKEKWCPKLEIITAKAIVSDEKGLIYISSIDDIFKIKLNSQLNGLIHAARVNAMAFDKKNQLWLGSNKGLYKLIGDSIVSYSEINSFLSSKIKSITIDDNDNVWMATDGDGVIKYNDDDKQVSKIGEQVGLLSDICKKVVISKGTLWVGTNKGISSVSTKNGKYQITNYTVQEGLPSNEINDLLVYKDTVWAATNKGVTFFYPRSIKEKKIPPPIYITGIHVRGERMPLKNPLNLLPEQNSIKIDFSGIAYSSGKNILYKYKNTIDTGWNYTMQRTVQYDYLPGGNYTFQVYAQNSRGLWSKQPAVLNFTIKKFFWETFTFKIIMILSGLFLLFAVYKLAVYITERRTSLIHMVNDSEQKALRAQMNPHFIFNSLNSIQRFIINNDQEAAHRYLSMFGKLMRRILDNSSSSYITLEEEIKSLTLYLELEAMRVEHKFDYAFYIDDLINRHATLIPSMIIQPYVENAIWHGIMPLSGKGHISIKLNMVDEEIICTITDNGIGRKKSAALKSKHSHTSMGMKTTTERLELLKTNKRDMSSVQAIDLTDKQGNDAGTEIILFLPFKTTI